jgi:hypothetical protein
VTRLAIGLTAMVLGALFVIEGYVRLGFGRHGDDWYRPFLNPPSLAHVENLVALALGIAGLLVGGWIVFSELRRRP